MPRDRAHGEYAAAAVARGIPTLQEFFGLRLARRVASESGHADVVAGNNVLAHVPNLNDFVAGMRCTAEAGWRRHV